MLSYHMLCLQILAKPFCAVRRNVPDYRDYISTDAHLQDLKKESAAQVLDFEARTYFHFLCHVLRRPWLQRPVRQQPGPVQRREAYRGRGLKSKCFVIAANIFAHQIFPPFTVPILALLPCTNLISRRPMARRNCLERQSCCQNRLEHSA